MSAPAMPASSGSREVPCVKKMVLKRFSMRPSDSSCSTQPTI
jgi:hypothetical protein